VGDVSAPAPSGQQIELVLDDQRAVIVEVGGGVRSYEAGGRTILDGYGADEICGASHGQPLMPWPNRVRDGRYEWEGSELQLDISEPARGNAIHGLVLWRNWIVTQRTPTSVAMEHHLHPSSGYPFALLLAMRYELDNEGLTVTASAKNVGSTACPYGAGFHPYLAPPGAVRVDGCIVQIPADTRLVADDRLIPLSREAVEGTPYDFREARPLGDLVLDDCFTDLARGADGLARVTLSGADGAPRSALWLDSKWPFLMVFSSDTLTGDQHRRGLAVEPMSCASNAFQSGDGLVRLEPGEEHVGRWGVGTA
jgi:aldose 1-epimerase